MPTIFALLCQACGLSHREAAAFLQVRIDTVKSWSSGRNPAPAGALESLVSLADRIDEAADEVLGLIHRAQEQQREALDIIELGLASDDAEAQSIGWPCVGAQRAQVALVVARGMAEGFRFQIVPRGSTTATAGAADVHE